MLWVERITKMKIFITAFSIIIFFIGWYLYNFTGGDVLITYKIDPHFFALLLFHDVVVLFILLVVINVSLTCIKRELLDITRH